MFVCYYTFSAIYCSYFIHISTFTIQWDISRIVRYPSFYPMLIFSFSNSPSFIRIANIFLIAILQLWFSFYALESDLLIFTRENPLFSIFCMKFSHISNCAMRPSALELMDYVTMHHMLISFISIAFSISTVIIFYCLFLAL